MRNTQEITGKALARDPVCGMDVDPATARNVLEHGGKKYYFCCPHCLEKFRAAPEKYQDTSLKVPVAGLIQLGSKPAPPQTAMKTAATDPVCGMRVDPATARFQLEHHGEKFYFCSAGCLEKFKREPALYLETRKVPIAKPAPAAVPK